MFFCKIQKVSRITSFYKTTSVGTSEVYIVFSEESGRKTGATVSNKYQIQLKKSIFCRENPEAASVRIL